MRLRLGSPEICNLEASCFQSTSGLDEDREERALPRSDVRKSSPSHTEILLHADWHYDGTTIKRSNSKDGAYQNASTMWNTDQRSQKEEMRAGELRQANWFPDTRREGR